MRSDRKLGVKDMSTKDEVTLKRSSRFQILRRLAKYGEPDRGRIFIGLLGLAVNSVTNLTFPWVLGQAIDQDSALVASDRPFFIFKAAGIFLLGSIASWVRVYCLGTATDRITARIRKQLFDCYMDMKNMEFFDTTRCGEIVSVLENDVGKAATALTDKLAAGLRSINASINGSIFLFVSSPQLSSVSLGIVPFVGVAAMTLSKYSRKLADKLRRIEADTLSFVLERIVGIKSVRLNGREATEKVSYAKKADEGVVQSTKSHFAQGAFLGFIGLSTNVSLMAVLYVGGDLLAKGKMTAGGLTRFAMQSAFVGLGFSGLSTFYSDMVKSIDAADRVFTLIDKSTLSSTESSEKRPGMGVTVGSTAVQEASSVNISIADLSFSYRSRADHPVLKRITLTSVPGTLTAIVGKSGSGKSSLLAVMCGLYKPQTGKVAVCGVDTSSDLCTPSWLRQQIGVVEQLSGLFSGTIRENIAYGKDGATEEDIERAARAAAAHDFISQFPEGYDTQIGERGSLLSGGQRARLALARALVKDPPILLLDEPTGALDRENEGEVVRTLQRLKEKKCVVVFTHSYAVMQAADVIHVISDGKIVESGPLKDLQTWNPLADL